MMVLAQFIPLVLALMAPMADAGEIADKDPVFLSSQGFDTKDSGSVFVSAEKETFQSIQDLETLDRNPLTTDRQDIELGTSERIIETLGPDQNQVLPPSKYVSLSEYQSLDELHGDWDSFKGDIKELKQALDKTLGNTAASALPERVRPAENTVSARTAQAAPATTESSYYQDRESIPAVFVWLRRIIDFKNDSPLVFYGVLVFVLIVIALISALVALAHRNEHHH